MYARTHARTHRGDRDFAQRQASVLRRRVDGAVVWMRRLHARTHGVPASEQCRARRSADRCRGVSMVEQHAAASQPIDVGCLDGRIAVARCSSNRVSPWCCVGECTHEYQPTNQHSHAYPSRRNRDHPPRTLRHSADVVRHTNKTQATRPQPPAPPRTKAMASGPPAAPPCSKVLVLCCVVLSGREK